MSTRTARLGACLALLCASAAMAADVRVVAYVPNWVELKSFAPGIDYSKLTHINVAFENASNDTGDLSFNAGDDALVTAAHAHHVKVLVSIGGGAASADAVLLNRYERLFADASRAAFVAKVLEYVDRHQFDGLDVDIEGPGINKDYGAFVGDLGKALKAKGTLLTAAVTKGYGGSRVPDSAFDHFDFLNIMAYDGTGPWDPKSPGQHASMALAKSEIAYWLGRGLPRNKLVLGVPFYGYGFGDAYRKRDYPYSEIVSAFPGAESADQAGKTIWYNGIPTIKAKTQLVLDEGLGGVMIWSLDGDAKGDKSLLAAVGATIAKHGGENSRKK